MPVTCPRTLARAGVVGLALGAAVAGGASPAAAAPCPGASGVTVVVDGGHGITTGCAPGDPADGLTALRAAGFRVSVVQQFPGAVCRIDGQPADDRCMQMPPQDAYWSYWQATPGGTWTYSNVGPASIDPPSGSVEGWAFGAGTPPSIPPPQGRVSSASATQASSPTAPPSQRTGTPGSLLVGAGLVALLGGGAVWVARHRRDGRA